MHFLGDPSLYYRVENTLFLAAKPNDEANEQRHNHLSID